MNKKAYQSMKTRNDFNRRDFLKLSSAVGTGLVLGNPALWAQENAQRQPPPRPKTNIDTALIVPKKKLSLPGPFPGKVVQIQNPAAMADDKPNAEIIHQMFEQGLQKLTGKNLAESFNLFFDKNDVVGIKVNPVGPGLISTRLEIIDELINWLSQNGLPRKNIIIWDRFDYMLKDAGFTADRYPDIGIEGLQTMDESAAEGKTEDNSRWLTNDGKHVSANNFDLNNYYWADVDGPQDDKAYLNQHVFNGKFSYFGKLLTQKITKLINVPIFKNTGNGISMATKNLGYGAICNTGRLHQPLFFDVCTEVHAFPAIRDKLVLNITDGLRAQYDGGPMQNANFTYLFNTLFFATDPFALDTICQQLMVQKRKEMQVKVNEHPRFTEYLRYAERLGLGIADPLKIGHVVI